MNDESMVGLQLLCVFLLNYCSLIYVGNAKALIGNDLNQMDMINELLVILITTHFVAFTDFT